MDSRVFQIQNHKTWCITTCGSRGRGSVRIIPVSGQDDLVDGFLISQSRKHNVLLSLREN